MVLPGRSIARQLGLNLAFPGVALPRPAQGRWRTGEGFFSGDYVDTVHMQANAVWTCAGCSRGPRPVARRPVGAYGLSLGGLTTALVASLEDLDCVIAGIPATDYVTPRTLEPAPAVRGRRRALRGSRGRWPAWCALISPLALRRRAWRVTGR